MRALRLAPLCLLLLLVAPASRAETPAGIPNPRAHNSWVTDNAQILTRAQLQQIDQILTSLEKKTTAEVAVVTVKNMGGSNVEDFANKLFKRWGIGKKGKDNGVLILAAMKEHRIRIEVGYGLEGQLTNGKCEAIIRTDMVPNFRQKRYGTGLLQAVKSVVGLIEKVK
jgi:uncharacterized protein